MERIGKGKQIGLEQTGITILNAAGDNHECNNPQQYRRALRPLASAGAPSGLAYRFGLARIRIHTHPLFMD